MREIKITIPENLEDKNSVFSFALKFLKDFLHSSEHSGELNGLGNDRVISQFNLVKIINKEFNKKYTLGEVDFFLREYNRTTNVKIKPITGYKTASSSPVYLEYDLGGFIRFMKSK